MNSRRLYGLLVLNALGIHAFDGLPIIQFNKPEVFWDGTETLSYSYRLNASYHPRFAYAADIAAMGDRVLLVVGENDEANDARAFGELLGESGSVVVLPDVDHFGVFRAKSALTTLTDWLREQGAGR